MQTRKQKSKNAPANNKPLMELKLKGILGWTGLFFFVSAWMFVLGVFVGRGTAPVSFDINSLQEELAALKEAVLKKDQAWDKRVSSLDKGSDLGFHEELTATSKEEITRNVTPPKVKKRALSKKPVKPQTQKKAVRTDTVPEKKLTIQVAAFKDAKMAQNLVDELKTKGFPAYKVMGKNLQKGIWYRVRVGTFKNKADASDMLRRLKKDKRQVLLLNRL
jgi:septal ring-binding cell division protein DamX